MFTIALGSDHAGFLLKETIKKHLIEKGIKVIDFGTNTDESVDYPDYIFPAATSVSIGECDAGIVFGGSGNGEAIAANKVHGIRCGLCWNVESASLTKAHNNANMIALGGRMISEELGIKIVDRWLEAKFDRGRHQQRIDKITKYESGK
jgi:ribose 5-phosphate isomerase B